jgi:type IV secretion system protein VirB6
MAMFGSDLHKFLNEDVKNEINHVVTGDDESPEDQIDKNLAWMQVALTSIDGLDVMGDPTLDGQKTRAMWFIGIGAGGPAITGGTMLLLYEVAMALFIGLGPIFILCLLFDQTKPLFQRWLLYGIGTMFSMAVLSAMVSIALAMVTRVAAAFWTTALAGSLLGENFSDGMTSQAMQQGGMGLILTALIISAPPMAAMFFQGTLGQFMAFSQFGGGGGPVGHRPGESGYRGSSYSGPSVNTDREAGHRGSAASSSPTTVPNPQQTSGYTGSYAPQPDTIKTNPKPIT